MWRITVVCENSVSRPGFLGEHGFAAYVKTPDDTILFDTGQGFTLVPNSLRLQIDLRRVDKVALSHGHFDHTGGLLAFLGLKGPCTIIAHSDVLSERFRMMPVAGEEKPMSIGIPWYESYLTSRGARFQWVSEWSEISPGVFITGEVPRKTSFETGDPKFLVRDDDGFVPDPFRDDYSLVLDTPKGLVVILGCAHSGIINILNHVRDKTGKREIYAVLGGTHLDFTSPEQLNSTVEALGDFSIEKIAVSHCTGQKAAARLYAEFGDRFDFAPVGYTIEVS
ncbi:MBL fold metallo-hydrolase [Thermodesulforhabdus norvegica]|uniref:7,8-dihydropterin-6-yl-methyl-4-(Beta-D-ribofuranosyl)aminobenzene 5'-phosphate synthase n=1 Tax=Thermodesulforhabdus norvegica TaxID=39841 RepID=A0A1I4UQ73_9BACT|nr:MBL fold metallo-hydrolase [Thermodesulforhabdus norvegica]SFM91116.1 7,8-dihydropterin-6-yl-methyl-4-(beta-D-ribofuranosyl)aminobenzene 5'-phosphate synthase [Thermodesulforhabdus norvegica]